MQNYLPLQFFSFICFLFSVSQVCDLKQSVDHLEKERDFYFAKLRDIEILCQASALEDDPVRILMKGFHCSLVIFIHNGFERSITFLCGYAHLYLC